MRLEPGMLARSKAGHDKGRVYVIISTDGGYVYVADGDIRPVRRTKRKNSRHLQPILKMRLEGTPDDAAVRDIIRTFTRQGEEERSGGTDAPCLQED
ncbi:MAG TPA: RNA-binding protein [Candidatus Mediterraneibacter merdipullorum]|nr:RNA-binding protein [Candidatus Mediterraneibacter merdipullorum]